MTAADTHGQQLMRQLQLLSNNVDLRSERRQYCVHSSEFTGLCSQVVE